MKESLTHWGSYPFSLANKLLKFPYGVHTVVWIFAKNDLRLANWCFIKRTFIIFVAIGVYFGHYRYGWKYGENHVIVVVMLSGQIYKRLIQIYGPKFNTLAPAPLSDNGNKGMFRKICTYFKKSQDIAPYNNASILNYCVSQLWQQNDFITIL